MDTPPNPGPQSPSVSVNHAHQRPALYLIPCYLDPGSLAPLPAYILDAVKACQVFFVENERTARRYLKSLWKEMVIDDYEWHPIHKAEYDVLKIFRQRIKEGKTIGLISEAGCPGIADPGQILTEAAHQAGITVHPLVGPSSILLALMASGLNGQQFRFSGYLPVDTPGRARAIKELETESARLNCTQIFIETPYRNNQLLETLLSTCRPATRLCIAANLTGPGEYIRTHTIGEWKQLRPAANTPGPTPPGHLPNLHKQPAIFCLLSS
ncbi:MAG: SAM-dependent methyltransferase [Bacteroidetes bacterium]|nr:SAM-dependent methyltransferase [Bacteroidota bacterium]